MGWVKRVPFRSHSGSITAGAPLFALTHPPYTSGALGVAGAEAGDRQILMCNSRCDLVVLSSIAGASLHSVLCIALARRLRGASIEKEVSAV